MNLARLIVLFELIFTAAVLPACAESEARADSPSTAQPAKTDAKAALSKTETKSVNVRTEKLAASELTEYIVAHGTTQAQREVTYSAEIPGKIEYLAADLGDRIKPGQVLARIDFETLKAQADQAEANYTLAKTTFDRFAALRQEDLVSQQQIDEASSKMTIAKAQLSIARANLAKSAVRASYPGIVNARYVEKSEYVGPGARLYDVVDYRAVIVEAQLAETQVGNIVPGAEVAVEIGALGQQFKGEVDTVIPTANNESKTFTVRIRIKNPDLKILIGMSATVRVTAAKHEDVIVVSQGAIIEESSGRSVFIAEGGVAVKRTVELGAVQGDRVVLTKGVSAGEELIVLGHRDLVDGQPITVVR